MVEWLVGDFWMGKIFHVLVLIILILMKNAYCCDYDLCDSNHSYFRYLKIHFYE